MKDLGVGRATLTEVIYSAFRQVQECDGFLLRHGAHERSIVYKFGWYLQRELDERDGRWTVDFEYNLEGHGETKTAPTDEDGEEFIFPDLIVHERGTHDRNFLVIEAKKTTNPSKRQSDRERLKAFTNDGEDNE